MEILRIKRKAQNMTQSDLAKKLGVDVSTITKMEKPGSFPRADKLPILAGIFGCTIDDLFKDTEKETA